MMNFGFEETCSKTLRHYVLFLLKVDLLSDLQLPST